MTLTEFYKLRRGDVVYGEKMKDLDTRSLYRVLGKATFVTETQKMTIHLTNVIVPNVKIDLSTDNLNIFDLTPYLKDHYGFSK
ncbi:hypothetical protein ES703_83778 [subsurface metagenome]